MSANLITNFTLEEKNNNMKHYKLNFDNCEYLVLINIENNKLTISCQNTTKFSNFCHKNSYSLEDTKKINKLFLCISSLDEIVSIFSELFKNKKVSLNKDKDNLMLNLSLTNLVGKEETISFTLNQSFLSNNELINKYFLQINNLQEIIEEEKKKNENLAKRVEELEKWKNLSSIINSRIIENSKEIDFIIERLKNNEEKKRKKFIF